MKKSHIATLTVFFVLIPLTLIVGSRLSGRAFYVTSTLVIVELLIPFFLAFEGRRPQARELVVLAVMCALAVAGRVAIPIPSFKAIFGIIMIAGIAFGPESGFLVGAISALASNFFYSQGPYTPWQMMAYGAGGMLAGWKFSNFKDGVFAEYFHVNEADANLALMPEGMDLGAACMLSDMVPTGFHGAELADIQFGDNVAVIGIGPVGLMGVAAAAIRGAAELYAVGSRKNCAALALEYGATQIVNYRDGDIVEQILDMNHGPVDKVIVAGGDVDTMDQAIRMLKPGGAIGNVNYLGEGDYVRIPRVEWGCGMGHKRINGGLMCGGRLRTERLARLVTANRIHPEKLITHTFHGLDSVEPALMLMRNKPRDLIKPLVYID